MNIPGLVWLDVSDNQLSDLRPLIGIGTLAFLNASNNSVTSTAPFSMMTGLTELYPDNNRSELHRPAQAAQPYHAWPQRHRTHG